MNLTLFSSMLLLDCFDFMCLMITVLYCLFQLTPAFSIDCLEKASFTIRSPLNADQKIATLEAFLKCCHNLKVLVIKVCQMKNCESAADDFFMKILGLKFQYSFIKIE